DYEAELAEMPPVMFEDIKSGLLNNLRQKPQRLSSLSGRFWSDILIEEYEQDSTLAMADAIESLEKTHIVDYYRRYVSNPQSARIVAVSVGTGHLDRYLAAREEGLENVIVISDLIDSNTSFKQDAQVFHFNP
ncbi:MAG: hypothetical protein WD601_12410, partial [Pseudohongiellaceae bacterium]